MAVKGSSLKDHFEEGDKVDVYHEGNLILKNKIISNIYGEYNFGLFDVDYSVHVSDLRHSKEETIPTPPEIRNESVIVESAFSSEFNSLLDKRLNEGYSPLGYSHSNGMYSMVMAISREVVPENKPNEFKG